MAKFILMNWLIFLLWLVKISVYASEWDYGSNGPATWGSASRKCSTGRFQSPINILTTCTIYKRIPPFRFSSGYRQNIQFKLKNNGHTVVAELANPSQQSSLYISGGGLDSTYYFDSFHLHWGASSRSGSEHHVNDQMYAGEIHFVHKTRGNSRIAVLGMFIQVSLPRKKTFRSGVETPSAWRKYIDTATTLKSSGRSARTSLSLTALMAPRLGKFWRYTGSLTTPPCTEPILWTVFNEPIVFPRDELQKFRNNILPKNVRNPQPLKGRKVERNYAKEIVSARSSYNRCNSG